jgi:hypothetical protein
LSSDVVAFNTAKEVSIIRLYIARSHKKKLTYKNSVNRDN